VLELRAREADEQVVIEIADTGPGTVVAIHLPIAGC
jgi:signal transduction histidine kinase